MITHYIHIYLSGIFSQFKVFTVFYKNTFLHISPFYPTTKILCFILLFKGPDSPKLAPSLVGIWTPSEIWFLLPTRIYNSNGISIGLAVLHSSPQRVPILYNGPQSPPQNCPFPREIWTPSNTWLLESTRVLNPNGISIASAVFAGLTSVTDKQTDRQPTISRSVTIGRIYTYVVYCDAA